MAVPGLGAYSARAILSLGYGLPSAVVDSNVGRVFARVFKHSISSRPTLKVLQACADYLLSPDAHRLFNLGLLDLGSLVCRPIGPRCDICPVSSVCDDAFQGNAVVCHADGQVSHWLRRERTKCGLSLVRMAQLSGVSKSTVISIEQGRVNPRPDTISRLQTVLQVVGK